MTEPLRIWDAKNLQWINEPHVPVARNPNPVAPKTDTPATQIPDDLKTLYGNAQAFRHAFGSGRFVGAGTVEVLIERIANLESTLAAERASRVQADTDGWVNVKDRLPEGPRDVLILLGNAIVERGYWYRMDTPIDGWYFRGSRVDNVTHWQPLPSYPAKPSVSPEQEKP